jgi:uncharacterized protein YukE
MAEEIYVSDTMIKTLGTQFNGWAEDVKKLLGKITGVTITPGDFPAGTHLQTTFGTRRTELATNLENIETALTTISTNLNKIAELYKGTDHDNTITAQDIDPLINGVDTSLPGLNK